MLANTVALFEVRKTTFSLILTFIYLAYATNINK